MNGDEIQIRRLKVSTHIGVPDEERAELTKELAEEHKTIAGGLPRAVELGLVDEVIDPASTRARVIAAIADAPQLRGDHGNIPL